MRLFDLLSAVPGLNSLLIAGTEEVAPSSFWGFGRGATGAMHGREPTTVTSPPSSPGNLGRALTTRTSEKKRMPQPLTPAVKKPVPRHASGFGWRHLPISSYAGHARAFPSVGQKPRSNQALIKVIYEADSPSIKQSS